MTPPIQLDADRVAELKARLGDYTRTLIFRYWSAPLIATAVAAGLLFWIGRWPTAGEIGGLMVFSGICLGVYAAPAMERGNEVARLLVWSGHGDCPEIAGRFGYDRIKALFYLVETVLAGAGTLLWVLGP